MMTENDETPEPVEDTDDDQTPIETPPEDPSEPTQFVVPDAEPDTGFTIGH